MQNNRYFSLSSLLTELRYLVYLLKNRDFFIFHEIFHDVFQAKKFMKLFTQ